MTSSSAALDRARCGRRTPADEPDRRAVRTDGVPPAASGSTTFGLRPRFFGVGSVVATFTVSGSFFVCFFAIVVLLVRAQDHPRATGTRGLGSAKTGSRIPGVLIGAASHAAGVPGPRGSGPTCRHPARLRAGHLRFLVAQVDGLGKPADHVARGRERERERERERASRRRLWRNSSALR